MVAGGRKRARSRRHSVVGHRRRRRRMRGSGWLGDAWDAVKKYAGPVHDFIKDNKLVSKGLNIIGKKEWADGAAKAGYGRRRRRHVMRGGFIPQPLIV